MKILMISDLHIKGNDKVEILHRINKICEILNREMTIGEKLIVLICGDVVDKGKKEDFVTAHEIFDYMIDKAKNMDIEFLMVPGNHDLCDNSFNDFDSFAQSYCPKQKAFEQNHCISVSIGNLNFILANSAYHKKTDYGKVDTDMVEENANCTMLNILVTHHSTISEDAEDKQCIRDVPKLHRVINKMGICFHFHGHTHGTYPHCIANHCYSIGVGAAFMADLTMGSQFNLIEFDGEKFISIDNFYYVIDRDYYISDKIWSQPEEALNIWGAPDVSVECQFVTDYIPRMAGPFDVVQSSGRYLRYQREQLKPLHAILDEKTRVVLLGEAGMGKSYELKYLQYLLKKGGHAFPAYIELNTYVDETIDDLIERNVHKEHRRSCVLIFDGYDEIEDCNLNTFAKRLNDFVNHNSKRKIIISTRNNFYKNAMDETNAGTFRSFYECGLCPLQENDILEYLNGKDIDTESFMEQIRAKRLMEQMKTPFFLVQIADLYLRDTDLPPLNELMDKLIEKSFRQDEVKYVTTRNIQEQQNETVKAMRRVAFAMQCMKKVFLEEMEYQELLGKEDRESLKYCGIWEKTGEGKWKFEHNNFREYLAAQYFRKVPLEEILWLVTYKDNPKKIKNSWVNVLSFLILIYQKKELLDWIIEISPSTAVKFEKTRLNEEIRTKIFCAIMEEHKNTNQWISTNQNDEQELAEFGQTKAGIDYLITEIKNPRHFRSLSNAIRIIGNVTDFYGERDEVRSILLQCCFDTAIRTYEVKEAILALTNPQLYDESDIGKFMEYFADEMDSDIRYALYCYILEYRLWESTIDFVLKGIEKLNPNNGVNASERLRLKEILKKLDSYEAIHKVFLHIMSGKDYYEAIRYMEDILGDLCENAEILYKMGKVEILDDIQNLFIKAAVNCDEQSMRIFKTFLENTSQIFLTYEYILSTEKNLDLIYILESIMDERCIDDLTMRYENDVLNSRELFITFVRRRREGSYRYQELRDLICQKDGIMFTERETIDYIAMQREGEQRYFDALFSKEKFQVLIEELADFCNGKETTYKDLGHSLFIEERHYDLEQVSWAIWECNFSDNRIINFLSYVPWLFFSINQICKAIRNKTALVIRKEQKAFINNWCRNIINHIDFEKDITLEKDGSISYTWEAACCFYFTWYFNVDYDIEIVRSMLMLPVSVFQYEENIDTFFVPYVLQRLDDDTIRKQVCTNLKDKKIEGDLADTYIKYCMKNEMWEACELAGSITSDIEYAEWIRRNALKYLILIKGADFILEKYLECADNILLRLLIDELLEARPQSLIERLIEENKKAENVMKFLKPLILMDCTYGLERYYEIAKEKNTLPDWIEENKDIALTRAIGQISEKRNLGIIVDLAQLAMNTTFKDKEFFGLYNSVSKAVQNIGQNAPEYTIRYLREILQKKMEDEFLSWCNYNLMVIEEQYNNQRDTPWEIEQVKKYMEQINLY